MRDRERSVLEGNGEFQRGSVSQVKRVKRETEENSTEGAGLRPGDLREVKG